MIVSLDGFIAHDFYIDFGICHDHIRRTHEIEKRSATFGKLSEAFKKRD